MDEGMMKWLSERSKKIKAKPFDLLLALASLPASDAYGTKKLLESAATILKTPGADESAVKAFYQDPRRSGWLKLALAVTLGDAEEAENWKSHAGRLAKEMEKTHIAAECEILRLFNVKDRLGFHLNKVFWCRKSTFEIGELGEVLSAAKARRKMQETLEGLEEIFDVSIETFAPCETYKQELGSAYHKMTVKALRGHGWEDLDEIWKERAIEAALALSSPSVSEISRESLRELLDGDEREELFGALMVKSDDLWLMPVLITKTHAASALLKLRLDGKNRLQLALELSKAQPTQGKLAWALLASVSEKELIEYKSLGELRRNLGDGGLRISRRIAEAMSYWMDYSPSYNLKGLNALDRIFFEDILSGRVPLKGAEKAIAAICELTDVKPTGIVVHSERLLDELTHYAVADSYGNLSVERRANFKEWLEHLSIEDLKDLLMRCERRTSPVLIEHVESILGACVSKEAQKTMIELLQSGYGHKLYGITSRHKSARQMAAELGRLETHK